MVLRTGRGLPCSPRENALRLLRQPPRRNGETHGSRIVSFRVRSESGAHAVAGIVTDERLRTCVPECDSAEPTRSAPSCRLCMQARPTLVDKRVSLSVRPCRSDPRADSNV